MKEGRVGRCGERGEEITEEEQIQKYQTGWNEGVETKQTERAAVKTR